VQAKVVPTFVMQKWERIWKEENKVCGIFNMWQLCCSQTLMLCKCYNARNCNFKTCVSNLSTMSTNVLMPFPKWVLACLLVKKLHILCDQMINHTPPFPMNSSHEMPPPSPTRLLASFGHWNKLGGWVILFFCFIGAYVCGLSNRYFIMLICDNVLVLII
jgi:hypothetical protein